MTFEEVYQQIRKMHYEILDERESISKSARLSLSTWMLDILTEYRMAIEALSDNITESPNEAIKRRNDAIDLVRCKDCRHRIHDEERCLYYCEMYYGQGDVSDDNFCQWGAKMDGDMSDGERSEE